MADLRNYQARAAAAGTRADAGIDEGPARLHDQGLQPYGAGSGDHRRRCTRNGVSLATTSDPSQAVATLGNGHMLTSIGGRPLRARPCAGSSCWRRWASSCSCRSVSTP